jgi:hypothetical protein
VSYGPGAVVPYSFDLSTLAPRSVASLFSHLVTRPTGRALRLGIESQIGELGSICLSVLDFTQVVVLDYSCADEAIAKLIQRYVGPDRPADVFFVARGLGEQHRQPIEAVLARHDLALAAEFEGLGFLLLGTAGHAERIAWDALERVRSADVAGVAEASGLGLTDARVALESLAGRRVVLRYPDQRYAALSSVMGSP